MANILYYSVHEPLEFDDIRLFRRLGHCVFPLGAYFPLGMYTNPFRPPIHLGLEIERAVPSEHAVREQAVEGARIPRR